MGTKPQLFCVNCKHFKKQYGYSRCYRKAEMKHTEPSPVNGHVSSRIDGVELCFNERRWNESHYCAPDGRFYEEARLSKRLIAWLKA